MSSSFKTSPTGHPSGRTALAAHSGSTTLFTGGADGWVRSWAAQTMLDKKDLYEADQGDLQVVSLGFCPPRSLLVGLERDEMDGQVRLVDCDTGALVTNVTKTPLGVRDVAASADGKWAAVATERSGLRIVDLSNVAEVHSREDHMGAVKGVSFDSQTEWLASMGADGTLKLWACGRQFELVHSLPVCERDDAMVKGSDAGRGTRKPAWSPRGDLLAVPGAVKVLVYKRGAFAMPAMQWDGGHTSVVSHVAFGSSGLLASASADRLCVHTAQGVKVRECALLLPLHCLAFSGDGACVAGMNTDGDLVQAGVDARDAAADVDAMHAVQAAGEEEDVKGESLTQLKAELGFGPDGELLAQPQNEDEDDDDGEEGGREAGGGRDARRQAEEVRALQERLQAVEEDLARAKQALQPAFQPGSTPWGSDRRRILAWNVHGSITSRQDGEKFNVEVEFAESSSRRAVRFTEDRGYQLAALASTGAVFASARREDAGEDLFRGDDADGDEEAWVLYQVFDRWDDSPDFKMRLGQGDAAVCVAAGDEFGAVATAKGLLRVVRPSGLQDSPVLLPPDVVCMAGCGAMLLVVHRVERNLGFWLLNLGNEAERFRGPKTLAKGLVNCARISWAGFADDSLGYMPCVLRDDGLLLGLSAACDWAWTPMLDTMAGQRKLKMWPISVTLSVGLVGVTLPNTAKAVPAALPLPVPTHSGLKQPLLGVDAKGAAAAAAAKKYEFEAEANVSGLVLEQCRFMDPEDEDEAVNEAKADVAVLKNFVMSVRVRHWARALGLAQRLRSLKSLAMALGEAQKQHADAELVEKLLALQTEREREEETAAELGEQEQHREEGDHDSAGAEEENEDREENYPEHADESSPVKKPKLATGRAPPRNPFAIQASSPGRAVPSPTRSSPVKQAKISRQSSFSHEARVKKRLVE